MEYSFLKTEIKNNNIDNLINDIYSFFKRNNHLGIVLNYYTHKDENREITSISDWNGNDTNEYIVFDLIIDDDGNFTWTFEANSKLDFYRFGFESERSWGVTKTFWEKDENNEWIESYEH